MTRQRRRRRKTGTKGVFFGPLAFVIIVIALIFGMSVFFRVTNIEVTGNSIYTTQEVIEASGVEEGDNLFFVNSITAGSRIISRLPYVSEASVERNLPDRVIIKIRESQAIAYIMVEDTAWVIDSSCKLLGPGDLTEVTGLIKVTGLTAINPSIGEVVAPGEEDTVKVTYLASILRQAEMRAMAPDITSLDITNVADPTFEYLGRFTVKLGRNENVDYKMGLLESTVEQLSAGDSGTIDLSIDNQAHVLQN